MKTYLSAAAIILLGSNVQASLPRNDFKLKLGLLSKVQSLEKEMKNIENYLI